MSMVWTRSFHHRGTEITEAIMRGLLCVASAPLWRCSALLIALALAPVALSQTAPAGNEHPDVERVSEHARELPSPFGTPDLSRLNQLLRAPEQWTYAELAREVETDAAGAARAKRELAEAVDLAPLRDLAVSHNGRIKILDTLARGTIRSMTGRTRYADPMPAGGTTGDKEDGKLDHYKYDPLFTLLDVIIDPAYYADRPLIGVEYLPLRREMLEMAFDDERQADLWLRFARVSPLMALQLAPAIQDRLLRQGQAADPYRKALNSISIALDEYQFSSANMLLVAPQAPHDPYRHISTLPREHPARAAALALGAAWRAGDAPGVNAAAAALAEALPAISPEVYPGSRRGLELTYNEVKPFEWGMWLYLGSFVSLVLAFGTGRRWLVFVGLGFLALALGFHGFGFITRSVLAERLAIQNQFESMTGLSFFAAIVASGIMALRRQWLFGAAAAAVGFMVLTAATQTGIPGQEIGREAAILNTSVLLKYHVTTVLASYGLISLGFVASLFYLVAHFGAKSAAPDDEAFHLAAHALGDDGAAGGRAKTRARLLADLDTAQLTLLQLAFWTLGVGILLGAWWADHSWGRWWAFDPKETWALITWIIYLIVIHVRHAAPARKGLVTAILSVVGFFMMIWTYFGVNLLLPGLHAYA
jgi:cytochrome c-type biogenesis protein CcsB